MPRRANSTPRTGDAGGAGAAAIRRTTLEEVAADIADPICRWLPDTTLTFVNDAYCRLHGLSAATALGRRIVDLVGAQRAAVEADVAGLLAALTPAQPVHAQEHAVGTAGATRWVQWTNRGLFDADGRLTEVQSVGRDITAYKRAVEELEESRRQLGLALDAADMGLWDWDLAGGTLVHDARWAAQLGYTAAEVNPLPVPPESLVHPDDLPAMRDRLRAHLRGATPYYASEHRLRMRGGAWRWVHARGQVVARDPGGRALRVVGLQRDISDRKAAEIAQRESEARLRLVLDSVPDFVSVVDLDGRITFLNRSMPALDPRRIVGRRFWEVAYPHYREQLQALFVRAVRDGTQQTIELQGADVRGEPTWYVSRLVPTRGDGAVTGIIIITSESTAQHQREDTLRRFNAELEERVNARTAELQASLRELESFSYSVSHDLRAPLRAIDGFAEALREDYGAALDGRALGYLERVRRAAQHMGRLIDDLLGLARVMRGDLRLAPVPIGAVAREIAADLQQAEPDRHVAVRVDEKLVAVGDETLLRVALTNLLANAWKFTRPRPDAVVEFGAETRGAEQVFHVRDNGVGFDMAYAAKLFRPFQRLHEPSQFEGTGIGLATVQRIVARHGGWVWAESSVGDGATFYFTLPAAASAVPAAPTA